MRQRRTVQRSIFENYAEHEIGYRLKSLSDILDSQPKILELIEADLRGAPVQNTGRCGLSVESIFRCLLLKQELQVSYDHLAFLLGDSITYNTFARLNGLKPKRSGLQKNIRRIKHETLEKINILLMKRWIANSEVNCKQLRIDTTVTKSNISPPSDSQLLRDGIRVLSRLFSKSRDQTGIKIRFTDKRVAAKSLAFRIFNAKEPEKVALYPELIKMSHLVNRQASSAISKVSLHAGNNRKRNTDYPHLK